MNSPWIPFLRLLLKRLFIALNCTLASALVIASIGGFVYLHLSKDLPDISKPLALQSQQSTLITDRTGRELYRVINDEDRLVLDHSDIPDHLRHAFIAIEDERFRDRTCIDVEAIARAARANLTELKSQGASTITQQLVRSRFLTREKTLERKAKEIILACRLENIWSKDQILLTYMNTVALGGNIAGVGQASQRFFDKDVPALSLGEIAVLAALPQRPTALLRDPDALFVRSQIVLGKMHEQGYLNQTQYDQGLLSLSQLKFQGQKHILRAPHFSLATRDKTHDILSFKDMHDEALRSGITVQTTLDPLLQTQTEEIVLSHAQRISEDYEANNAAVVIADRQTREILAYVGNIDYFADMPDAQVDMASRPRQPGSSFKPFVYAGAFLAGNNPNTIIRDEPMNSDAAQAENYGGGFWGRMTARMALAWSRNVPAVKAQSLAGGEDQVLELAYAMGARTPLEYKEERLESGDDRFKYGWPLALGSAETPLWQMVQGYTTLANDGEYAPLLSIRSIRTQKGETLYAPLLSKQQIIPRETARQVTDVLRDAHARPDDWRPLLTIEELPAAVKTGTSNVCFKRNLRRICTDRAPRDAWTIGYTDDLVIGVWVGNASGKPMTKDASGLTAASPLWKEVMVRAHTLRGHYDT